MDRAALGQSGLLGRDHLSLLHLCLHETYILTICEQQEKEGMSMSACTKHCGAGGSRWTAA